MKRKLIVGIVFSILSWLPQARGQSTVATFFNQKEEQRKLYMQQIAAFQMYLRYLQGGYRIIQNGTKAIHGFKNGEFALHKDYIASLSTVNPMLLKSTKLKAILDCQQEIKSVFRTALNDALQSGYHTDDEIGYLRAVYTNLVNKCSQDLDELSLVITPGKMQLSDAERLNRIDKVYSSMKDKHAFACFFTDEVKTLTIQRAQLKKDTKTTQQLYGLD